MTKTDEIEPVYRKKLLAQLKKINPKTVVKVASRSTTSGPKSDHFSDWNDKFRDGGGFTDAWGRSPPKDKMQKTKRKTVKRTIKQR